MNRKQSHQPIGSHSYAYHKTQFTASPYIDLLDSKKGVYGHRYDTKNIRSITNYVKPSPASISSIFQQKPKSVTSASTEKVKIGSSYTNQKKKRSRTEQADEKMHQSLFIYPTGPQKAQQQPQKSPFNPFNPYKSIHPHPQQQGSNPYTSYDQRTYQKNKRKRHLSQNKHNHRQSLQASQPPLNLLQSLQIHDIDGLINLIDNCVREANQYIAYLSEKMAENREQLLGVKGRVRELEDIVLRKNVEISVKEDEIKELNRKLVVDGLGGDGRLCGDHGFEVKNLLQIIEKLSEENQRLRAECDQGKSQKQRRTNIEPEKREKDKEKDGRADYFNEIHSKIDILNISIDSNNNFSGKAEGKEKTGKDVGKYKFIKPKGR